MRVIHMSKMEIEELRQQVNSWLETMMDIYREILEDWETHEYVKPFPNAKITFQCNDCGKCCNFREHDVWVYPSDMVNWLDNLTDEKYVPLFLTAIFPKHDLDDIQGYGLPSQKELQEAFSQILVKEKKNQDIVQTIRAILKIIRGLNPSFDKTSDYCIYYNHHPKTGSGHCSIYSHRPIQCRSFPFDYPNFTQIKMPESEDEDDPKDLPICPEETYKNGNPKDGVITTPEQRDTVTIEKANYRTSSVLSLWAQESEEWRYILDIDIFDLLLEYFHADLVNFHRKSKMVSVQRGNKEHKVKLVAGKRPTRKKPTQKARKKSIKEKTTE